MIRSRMKWLRLAKEERDGVKLTYRTIATHTGISTGALMRLMNSEFDRVDSNTLNALCRYFGCQVGDLLEYVPDAV